MNTIKKFTALIVGILCLSVQQTRAFSLTDYQLMNQKFSAVQGAKDRLKRRFDTPFVISSSIAGAVTGGVSGAGLALFFKPRLATLGAGLVYGTAGSLSGAAIYTVLLKDDDHAKMASVTAFSTTVGVFALTGALAFRSFKSTMGGLIFGGVGALTGILSTELDRQTSGS